MTEILRPRAFTPAEDFRGLDRLAGLVETSASGQQVTVTQMEGLTLFRALAPCIPMNCVYEPCIALILQGSKTIIFGDQEIACGEGAFFATAIDVPTSAQITVASRTGPISRWC